MMILRDSTELCYAILIKSIETDILEASLIQTGTELANTRNERSITSTSQQISTKN